MTSVQVTSRIPMADTLEEVLLLSPKALLTLYNASTVPNIKDLEGHLDGACLAFPFLKSPLLKRMANRYSISRKFIWKGKVCHAIDETHGEAINILEGNRQKFRCQLYLDSSLKDNKPALIFDYKGASNPGIIKKVRGEIREVAPDLWIGLEYLNWGSQPKLLSLFLLTKKDLSNQTRKVEPIFPKMGKFLNIAAILLPIASIIWFIRAMKRS